MSFCTKCGNQLKPGAKFCSRCGQITGPSSFQVHHNQNSAITCPRCNSIMAQGLKFCVNCGAPLALPASSSMNEMPFSGRGVSSSTPVPEKRRKTVRVFSVLVSMFTLLAVAVVAIYFWGNYKRPSESTSNQTTTAGTTVNTVIDSRGIEAIAATTEHIFAKSDTAALASVMSTTLLEQRRPYLGQLIPYMPAFAEDFKTRRLLYSTERYAVYEFSSSGGKFTVDFCLGEDGTWKIMRF